MCYLLYLLLSYNIKQGIMNLENLYNATVTFTDKQIENVTNLWAIENDNILMTFNSLILLGDSMQVAFASSMVEKYKGDNSEFYINAYTK